MIDPAELKSYTDKIEALFGKAALVAADARMLRERAKDDSAKADALEAQALKLRDAARSIAAKGPGCGCGGDPAILPPTQTVDSSAVTTHG
jgi:hypothetical protein